ncbi:glutathione S-transferase [Pseudolabrys taiwanensis]|uniref:Glutathione S-transferase n=1 Tax=Pseudolabrys taiwanensis TaxID=331696 RepID=A0A345ZWH5_9HYPH|nr:glutathione S-transferase N-terminal domain-containing protein [Pseudolabrys taiwanensis]AXK81272.1 glutathione S-transferase [Pseudolabrys taiwanensis]
MLTLYYAPGSCALATHIALFDAGAPFETKRVDFGAGEQRRPDYLAVNPKARVPALATEHGVLTETPALLAYVAQRFPAAKLAPIDDPFAFAQVQEFNSYLCSTAHVAHAHLRRGTRWVDAGETDAMEAMKRYVPTSVAKIFELIDSKMLKGPWVLGERYSICDPYLYTLTRWLGDDGVDINSLPKVREHRARMIERDSVKRALAEQDIPA